ncbi:Trypsin [Rhodococcus maanshanensis]|uniref:Trypsin n=2 Tax=Rhodococcus maanshanensis TaxID=183556 RepID=A0A1H7F009_9NOCA|nr:Trypsin [Rhodococcus maanshanensis]
MRLKFDNIADAPGTCTLGAVGTDATGRKIGITAGHCNRPPTKSPYPGVTKRVVDPTNNHPVWDWRDLAAGPIGYIRYVSADDTDGSDLAAQLEYYKQNIDYMVIEFADNVELSSTIMTVPKYGPKAGGAAYDPPNDYAPGTVVTPSVPWGKVNAIYSDSSGNPAVPPQGGIFTPTEMCHAGAITQQQNSQNNQPDSARCGVIYHVENQNMYTSGFIQPGDSGGPVWVKNQFNKWAGITSWVRAQLTPLPGVYYVYTSAKKILDDMNSKAAGFPGKGFQITNN